jgi:hypothetical protein
MRFSSPHPFFWCSTANTSEACRGMADFLSEIGRSGAAHATSSTSSSSHTSANGANGASGPTSQAADFHSASLYWIHPANNLTLGNPILKGAQEAASKLPENRTSQDNVCTTFMHKRWLEWEESFRSVYYRLRNKRCGAFYYESPKFVVLFLAPDSGSGGGSGGRQGDFQAVITKSTGALRTLLTQREVRFTRPLWRAVADPNRGGEDEAPEEGAEGEHGQGDIGQGRGPVSYPNDFEADQESTAASLLLVTGKADVHALYDVLLNFNKRSGDVPLLYCDYPFINATVKSIAITKNNELPRAFASAVTHRDDRYCCHSVVTLLLNCCSTVVTLSLHCCHTVAHTGTRSISRVLSYPRLW